MTDPAYSIIPTLGVPGSGQTRALLKPIETILSDAPRAAREHFLTAIKEALRLDAARVKPTRRPSIATLVKRAEKTGKTVTSITRDDTTINFDETKPSDASNPWLADLPKVKQ